MQLLLSSSMLQLFINEIGGIFHSLVLRLYSEGCFGHKVELLLQFDLAFVRRCFGGRAARIVLKFTWYGGLRVHKISHSFHTA